MSQVLPKISVIVPVYNCGGTIGQCLHSLCALDYPSYEVIVVDDGSTDNTADICRSYPMVHLFSVPNGGPSKARNLGALKATGEILAFTDGDCVVDRQWLKELQKGFSDSTIAGVGGNQASPIDETAFGTNVHDAFLLLGIATSYMKNPSVMTETSHNPSCNSSYRKSVFLEIGGFDERLWPGEDVDMDWRITHNHHKLMRCPLAVVGHYRPNSFKKLGNMMNRYGASAYRLFRRYGFFRPLHYIPFATVFLLACLVSGSIFFPALLLLPPITLAALFLLLCAKTSDWKKASMLLILSIFIFINWHLGFFSSIGKAQAASPQ